MRDLFDAIDAEGARIREVVRAQREAASYPAAPAAKLIGRTLRTDSIGTCAKCSYHGPGPAHACTDPEIARASGYAVAR